MAHKSDTHMEMIAYNAMDSDQVYIVVCELIVDIFIHFLSQWQHCY